MSSRDLFKMGYIYKLKSNSKIRSLWGTPTSREHIFDSFHKLLPGTDTTKELIVRWICHIIIP
jgi:hypothetical protein